MDTSVANITLQLKEEVIRLRQKILDDKKKYQGQIDNLAAIFVLESEKSGNLQRQVELLENENGVLKGKLRNKVVDQSNADKFAENIDYNEMEFLFAKGKIVKLENDVNNDEKVITKLKEKLKVVLDEKKKLKDIIQEQKVTEASLVDDVSELDEKAEEWKNLYHQTKEKLDELKLERDNEERNKDFDERKFQQSNKRMVPAQSFDKSDINNKELKTEERPFRRNTSQLTLPPFTEQHGHTKTETISSSGMNFGKYQPTPPDQPKKYQPTPPDQPRKYQPTPPDQPRPDHPKREMRKKENKQNVAGDRDESNANDRVWFVSF